MYQPTSEKTYVEPSIYVYGQKLVVVPKFSYLESTLNCSNSIDDEVGLRISKASHAFGILHKRLWSRHGISISTKVKVYNACVLTVLFYASETWTTYTRHLKQLKRFHQQCLRKILGIKWQMHISDTEILEMANIGSIEVLTSKQQLKWSGHLVRLPKERISKQIFYKFTWRKVSFEATGRFEESRRKHARLKRDLRKGNITEHVAELTCGHCGRPCLSRAGFLSHLRSHRRRVSSAKHEKISSVHTNRQNPICLMPYSNICNICGKICKSVDGMKLHEKVHIFNTITYPSILNPESFHICGNCGKVCKFSAGLKSHLRARNCLQSNGNT